jgi:hypothetical protein
MYEGRSPPATPTIWECLSGPRQKRLQGKPCSQLARVKPQYLRMKQEQQSTLSIPYDILSRKGFEVTAVPLTVLK